MATRIKYQLIIEDISRSKNKTYVLTQDKARKICNAELPKSMFTSRYFEHGSNDLIRFLKENNYIVEITEPKITIRKG